MRSDCSVPTKYHCPQCGNHVIRVDNVPKKQRFRHWCKVCEVWVQPVARRIFVPETYTIKSFEEPAVFPGILGFVDKEKRK